MVNLTVPSYSKSISRGRLLHLSPKKFIISQMMRRKKKRMKTPPLKVLVYLIYRL
jgi:hypothetical protein